MSNAATALRRMIVHGRELVSLWDGIAYLDQVMPIEAREPCPLRLRSAKPKREFSVPGHFAFAWRLY
jgi:hypothetical protein